MGETRAEEMRRLSGSSIIAQLAEREGRRIGQSTIRALQLMPAELSGDGSGLKSVWEEVCVQEQVQHSFSWCAYERTIEAIVGASVEDLPRYVLEAIWLQTQAGEDWECEDPEDRDEYPVWARDVIDHVIVCYVRSPANDWSNARIRAFISRRISCD